MAPRGSQDASPSRHRRILAVAVAFGVAQIVLAMSGWADSGALCDDAFYYFQIAKHAAAGLGFSFDGVSPTNGFHPLFGWLLVPVWRLFGHDAWVPIRIAQATLGMATALTGYVLFRIGRAHGDDRAGELAAAFFFLSPFAWILPHRGCEGGLSIACIALGAWQVARLSRDDVTWRGVAVLGALVGLAGLARTENLFWAIAVAGWLLWRTRRPVFLLAFAAAAALVVSPWVIWNLVHFGTVMQVSGAAKVAFRLFHPLPAVKTAGDVVANLYNVFSHSTRFVVGEEFAKLRWTATVVVVDAVLVGVAIVAGGRRRPWPLSLAMAGFVALHLAYYAFVQRSYFNWYFLPVVLFAAVLQGERLARAPRWLTAALLGASALVCVLSLARFQSRYGFHPHGVEQEIEPILAELPRIPEGESVGAWNVGRIGYFGERRRPDLHFVNLDCVVNNALFAAWREGRYTEWVVDHVGWILEHPQGVLKRNVLVPVAGTLSRVVSRPRAGR